MNSESAWTLKQEIGAILLCFGISIPVLGLVYLFKAERLYEAVARIQIDKEQDNLVKLESFSLGTSEEETTYLQTQHKNMMSRSLIQSVCDHLRLKDDPRYARKLDLVKAVSEDISIVPIPNSRLVCVKAVHPDPKRAAEIANKVVDNFRERTVDLKREAAIAVMDRLRTEMRSEESQLEEATKQISEYRKQHSFVPSVNGQCPLVEPLMRAKVAGADAQARTGRAKDVVLALDAYVTAKKPLTLFPPIAGLPGIRSASEQIVLLETELGAVKNRYGEDANETKVAQAKLDAARSAVSTLADEQAQVLRGEVTLAESEEVAARATVQRWEQEMADWDRINVQYDVLRRRAETAGLLYSSILARVKETDLNARNTLNNILIIDKAVTPYKYVSPKILLTLGFLCGLGAILGLIGFVFRGALQVRVLVPWIAAAAIILMVIAMRAFFSNYQPPEPESCLRLPRTFSVS